MGVYRFRLGNKVLDACRGLSVGLFKKPIKTLNAKTKANSKKAEMIQFPVAATQVFVKGEAAAAA